MTGAQAFNVVLVIASLLHDFFGFSECIVLFISASVMGIIFMLGKFPGNESFRIELAFPFCIC